MIYDKTRAIEPGYYDQFEMVYKPALEKDRKDAERYRWLRERSRAYLGSNGMFMEITLPTFQTGLNDDTCIDVAIDARLADDRIAREIETADAWYLEKLRTTEPLLVAPPLTMCKAESTLKFSLNQCVDDYDLTSNDTRRGD